MSIFYIPRNNEFTMGTAMIKIASVALILMLVTAIILTGCSSSSNSDEKEPETKEWEEVKQAVETMFAEANPPITDLKNDERIDWKNSAICPASETRNMTGTISSEGEMPLLAISVSGSGIMSVNHYLGKDSTQYYYWIDHREAVHLSR